MLHKIKNYLLAILVTLTFGAPALVPVTTFAAPCTGVSKSIADGANDAAGGSSIDCGDTNVSTNSLAKIGRLIVRIFSLIVGIVAIIMIIYGGFRYITSGGDSGRVSSAKNTLIYAVIGLIVAALAQLLVQFVLTQSDSATKGLCPSNRAIQVDNPNCK